MAGELKCRELKRAKWIVTVRQGLQRKGKDHDSKARFGDDETKWIAMVRQGS